MVDFRAGGHRLTPGVMGGLVDLQAGWTGASAAGSGRAGSGSHWCHLGVLPASPGMQYHKLTEHFDEKPFSCEECGAKFAANSTLKNHLRLHTGDRPFMCKHCLMTFMQASALAYHTKKKHAEGEPSLWKPGHGLRLLHPLLHALFLHLPPGCFPILWGSPGQQTAPRSPSPARFCLQFPTLLFSHALTPTRLHSYKDSMVL